MIYTSLTDLIGGTPLLEIPVEGSKARVLAKLELFNPGGSVKDRIALSMILDAEQRGILKPGGTIIEPTSGNTGVGLAWIGRSRGYRVILTMPESMSLERRKLQHAYGAELVLTPKEEGMKGAVKKAEELRDSIPGSFIPDQFGNPANPKAHEEHTANEIWQDTKGEVDIFVSSVGTSGTLVGTSRELKRRKPAVKAYAVEPEESPLLSKGHAGPHIIQGIGANFVPANYDPEVVDGVIDIPGQEAAAASRELASKGILVGISSGAAFAAAKRLALKKENDSRTIVVIFPDTGERYLSGTLFEEQ